MSKVRNCRIQFNVGLTDLVGSTVCAVKMQLRFDYVNGTGRNLNNGFCHTGEETRQFIAERKARLFETARSLFLNHFTVQCNFKVV